MDRMGVSPTTILKMVRGGEAVSLMIIGKICEELGADVED